MPDAVYSLAVSPTGQWIAVGGVQVVVVLDSQTGNVVAQLPGHIGWSRLAVWMPDGKTLLTAADEATIRRWKMPSGQLLQAIETPIRVPDSLAVDPSGRFAVVGDADSQVVVALDSGQVVGRFPGTLGHVQFRDKNWIGFIRPGRLGEPVTISVVESAAEWLAQSAEMATAGIGHTRRDAVPAETWRRLGEWLAASGAAVQAVECFELAMQHGHPNDVDPLTMARLYWRIGAHDNALAAWNRVSRLAVPEWYRHLCVGAIHLDAAFEAATHRIARHGEADLDAFVARANVSRDRGDFVAALRDFAPVLHHDPTRDVGITYEKRFAFAYLAQPTDDPENYYAFVLRLDPDSVPAFRRRAEARRRAGKIPETMADLSEILARCPWDTRTRWLRARLYETLEQWPAAVADYERIIEIAPEATDPEGADVNAFTARGWAFVEMNDLDRALASFDDAIRRYPTDALAHNNRGLIFLRRNDDARALADFETAIRLEPGLGYPYENRGKMRERNGDFPGAFDDFSQVIQCNPENILGWWLRGNLRLRMNDIEGAVADYTEWIVLQPDAQAYFCRALAHQRANNFMPAATDLKTAVEIAPTYWEAWREMALLHYRLNNRPTAITAMQEAHRHAPPAQRAPLANWLRQRGAPVASE